MSSIHPADTARSGVNSPIGWQTLARSILLLACLAVASCASPEQKAQSYTERGIKLLAQGEHAKAAIEFKNALQLNKGLVSAWRGLLEIETRNNDPKKIVPILRTIVELDPNDISSKLKLGEFALGANLDQALELVNAVLELDPRNANALALRAAVSLKLNDIVAANRDAQAALEIDPANVKALLALAMERVLRRDFEGALSLLNSKNVSSADEITTQLFKLAVFERMGDLNQAGDLLRKLVESQPQNQTFRKLLIRLYVEQKDFLNAEKELRSLAEAAPTDVEAGLNVVRFLQQFKGPAGARQELVARTTASPKAFQYQLALAQFDFSQGKVADSIRLLEGMVKSATSPEDALAAQVKLAEIQLAEKKWEPAEVIVSDILRKDGRNIDGLKLRAVIRMQRGQLDPAVADLRQALNDQPRSSGLMVLLATAYERGGSIELADKQFAEATKLAEADVSVGLGYVAFLRRRGNLEQAEEILTEQLRRWPSDVRVWTALGEVRLARQNWTGAQQVAQAVQRLGTNRNVADQIMAAALSGAGQYDDSVKILESLHAVAPTSVQPMSALVTALLRQQNYDKATSFVQSVLKTNPSNAEAHVLMGTIQLSKGAPQQAAQSFRTAIERQPNAVTGYSALATFHVREKNIEQAEQVIRTGLKQQPDSPDLHMQLAGIFELKGDYKQAIAEYESLLNQQPGSLVLANNIASLLSEHFSDKASLDRAYAVAAVLRKSQVPAFKDTLGWIYYLRGDYKSATPLLEEAAAALTTNAIVQYHLGLCYLADGQTAKASEQLKKALAVAPPDGALTSKIRAAGEKAAAL